MRAALLLLALAAAASSAQAQIPGIADIPGLAGLQGALGDVFTNPDSQVALLACSSYMDTNQAGQEACAAATATAGCPDACKEFWGNLPSQCNDLIGQIMGGAMSGADNQPIDNPWDYFNQLCNADITPGDGTDGGDTGATDTTDTAPDEGTTDTTDTTDSSTDGGVVPPDVALACTQYLSDNVELVTTCMSAWTTMTGDCPANCTSLWENMPDACKTMDDAQYGDLKKWMADTCGKVKAASTFECDTAGGFSWVSLDAALATMVPASGAATSQEVNGPEVALNSTCATLGNATAAAGCCTQTPPANSTWVQYGLGADMVVQGVKLVAPEGNCCSDEACTYGYDSPCNERLLTTMLYVTNTSIAEVAKTASYLDYLAVLNMTDPSLVDANAALLLTHMGNSSAGLCNWVNTWDMFNTTANDGAMLNNGSVSIGCGMGFMGDGAFNVTGSTGAAVLKPQGSWLLLARTGDDQPLSYCGIQVCAKPADPVVAASLPAPAA